MTYRIKNNLLEQVGTKSTKIFKIVQVQPDGIKILTEADNGVEISKLIPWKDIK